MPQPQRTVPLILLRREPGLAVATGSSAAWTCVCRRSTPLIGCTGALKEITEPTRVVCPDCGRRYFVVPDGKDNGPALEVREV
jgi:DNA-directed RNA polymerase subunit RPC12/RpoP